MTAEIETTQTELCDNAYWPAEALLADFAGKDDRGEWPVQPDEDSSEYATLYFVS